MPILNGPYKIIKKNNKKGLIEDGSRFFIFGTDLIKLFKFDTLLIS
jgi:hypothetical protein